MFLFTIEFELLWMLFVERFSKIPFSYSWTAFFPTLTIFHYWNNDAKLLHNRLIFTNSVNFLTQTKQCLSTIGCFFLQLRTSSPDLGSFGLYPSTTLYTSHITEVIQDLMISFINKVLPTLQDSSPAQGETMT